MKVPFTKMHGISNDYVYVNAFETTLPDPSSFSTTISERRTSIGADGLILICPSDKAHARMEMYNADGTRGEMCGNGIRCVGKYVYDHGIAVDNPLLIDTDAGLKKLFLQIKAGKVARVTVDMGEPVLHGPDIPVASTGQVIEERLVIDDENLDVTCVSMGNPHCIIFVDSVDNAAVATIGSKLEMNDFFPNRVNVEFAEVLSPSELKMRVWERGSGETWACGTGACGVMVAAVLTGRCERKVTIHLRGGDLDIHWSNADNHIYMTGTAEEVYEGIIEVG